MTTLNHTTEQLKAMLPALDDDSRKIAEDAIALHEQLRWRPIETAPKDVEFRCLLAHRCSVVTGYWNGEAWINERSASGSIFSATHWMPLSSPPQENE